MNCPRCKRTAEEAKKVLAQLQAGELEEGPDACGSETCVFDFIVSAHYEAVEAEMDAEAEDYNLREWAQAETLAYG
jgi:hypothetical protein